MRPCRPESRVRPFLTSALFLASCLVAPAWAAARDCQDEGGDDRYERFCDVRELTVPAGRLAVDAAPNGGIEVRGEARSDIRIRAKVVAQARSLDEARALAAEVHIETDGVVRSKGPGTSRERSYWVSYEVFVPERADLRLETTNGGIALHDVRGTVEFKTTNGGVTVDSTAGSVHGRTTNGGINVSLRGSAWEGEGLDLETTNGGVKVQIPGDYNARLVTGTVNGGMRMDFPVTVQGRIDKRLDVTLGQGGPTVRVVTTNGGVVIGRR
jgi:putative adhesin